MSTLTYVYTFTAGTTAQSSQVNANFTAVATVVNGNLDNANLSASAGIVATKLNLTSEFLNLRSTNNRGFAGGVTGDTVPRIAFNSRGSLDFGPGSGTAQDIALTRESSTTLAVRDQANSAYLNFKALAVTLGSTLTSTGELPVTAGASDIGSTALPWANLYVGTAATNNNKITSVATAAARTFTLPDANSNSVIPDSGSSNNFLTAISPGGVISKAQPAFTNISGTSTVAQLPTTYVHPQQCRLYLISGSPTADGTDVTTNFYVGPYGGGNLVSLPDATGDVITTLAFQELTTALPTAIFRIYDVFLYNNSGVVATELNAWDSGGQSTNTITGASAANPCVLTCSNSWAAGDTIGIAGIVGTIGTTAANGLNGKVFRITSRTGTTITLETGADTTGLAYTSGGTAYKVPTSRTDAISLRNGMLLKTGTLTRLYIGTLMAGARGVNKQAEDNGTGRLVWNNYNRIIKGVSIFYTGSTSHTYSTAAWRAYDNNTNYASGGARAEYLVGAVVELFDFNGAVDMASSTASTTAQSVAAISNSVDAGDTPQISFNIVPTVANAIVCQRQSSLAYPGLGYNVLQLLQYSAVGAGTQTWYNAAAGSTTNSIKGWF